MTSNAELIERLAERENVNARDGLDSYYFDFEPTGVAAVDLILGAVCWAGKMYHSTEGWVDGWGEGPSEIDNIQKAAKVTASTITALEERIRVLSEENERLSRTVSAGILGDLLTDNETGALVAFVKSLRQDAALNQSNDDYCGIVVEDDGEEDGE